MEAWRSGLSMEDDLTSGGLLMEEAQKGKVGVLGSGPRAMLPADGGGEEGGEGSPG